MMHFRLSTVRLALVSALLACAAFPVSAQSVSGYGTPAPGTDYKLLYPALMSLSRPSGHDVKPGDFILRMTSRWGKSGCRKVGKVGYKTEFQDKYLDITVYGYTVDYNNLPLHPEYECSGNPVYPSAEIPLNVADLKKNGTTIIRFEGTGETDYYDITYGDHSIEIIPEPPIAQADPRYQAMPDLGPLKNPLKVWFYPEGTVILRTSTLPRNFVVRGQVDALARSHHLVPLDEVVGEFESPIDDNTSFYYVDKSKGHKVANAPGMKDGVPFGTVTLPATVYGADGDEPVQMPVQVFAHTPGIYE